MDQPEQEQLLQEKDQEIERLSSRVETLIRDRVTMDHLQYVDRTVRHVVDKRADATDATVEELKGQVNRLDHALFGVSGTNGLNYRVNTLNDGLHRLETAIERMREQEFEELKFALGKTRDSIRHWALGLLPVIVALLGIALGIAFAIHK